jgi:hypothetical protein
MASLIVLLILWVPYLVAELVLRARRPRTLSPAHSQPAYADPPTNPRGTATDGQHWLGWSAWDDSQLTRLLKDSAPRSITEQDRP